jgi:hypothetical protein
MTDLLTLVEHVRAEVLASAESASAAAGHLEQLGIIAETAAQDAAAAEHDLACWIASLTAPGACSCHGEITAQLGAIRAQLDRMEVNEERIIMSQQQIEADVTALTAVFTDVQTDVGTLVTDLTAIQGELAAGNPVSTASLDALVASATGIQSSLDTAVSNITAVATPAAPAPAPAVPGSTTGVSN